MAIYLDEDMMGRDAATIGFPHLLVCMGLVLRTNNALWGVHLTDTEASRPVFAAFWAYATNKGLAAGHVTDMYSSCNFDIRYYASSAAARLEVWKGEVTSYARVMNWQGNCRGFDTSVLAPANGTYVEYQHQAHGAPSCRIFYKKDEKTTSTGAAVVNRNGGLADCVTWDHYTNAQKPASVMKTGINVTTPGGIRELDYANRLRTFVIGPPPP
ncbi:hypothetical protein [Roseomonas sp. AR75]|uniref:hypothetical protein n=1 Tax=Roseomonas sp. AR75 TaxID=2562311 RepID=UPI0010C0C7AD|nr:hypothetical protein [Roseomonas sp. AR75]